jgi:hypothetical protein
MSLTSDATASRSGFELIARAVAVVSLTDLALVHVVDLPETLDETPLIGAGYLVLIIAAVAISVVLMFRSHWMAWAATGLVAAATMGAYILTRTVSGFLGDHVDVGNWRCSLGLAALSLETVLIALAAAQLARRQTPAQVPLQPASNGHRSYTAAR